MPRTTAAQVQKIIEYDATLIPDLTPFIADASAMVTELIGQDTVATAARNERVERYLAAHLVAVTDPRLQSEQVKSLLASYQNKLSPGLGITHYGTLAMTLDTSGKLAQWNTRITSGLGAKQFFWAGTTT